MANDREKALFDVAWPTILGLGAGLEVYALARPAGGLTLSSHIWDTTSSGRKGVRKAAVGIAMIYLSAHFLLGGPKHEDLVPRS